VPVGFASSSRGNPNGARALRGKQTGNTEAVAQIKQRAVERATDLKGIIEGIKRSGIMSVRATTEELNRKGSTRLAGELGIRPLLHASSIVFPDPPDPGTQKGPYSVCPTAPRACKSWFLNFQSDLNQS
jgi:hypothetical protein